MPSDPDISDRLRLPFIMPSQAQKHVTHNEALERLDALTHPLVKDRDLAAPPASPAVGDAYLVAASATGLWSGHEDDIATWQGLGWEFLPPFAGLVIFIADEEFFLFHDDTTWRPLSGSFPELSLSEISVNMAASPTARLSVASDTAVLSHDAATPGTGDMRAVINKAAAGNTASLLLQDNWSGRAEIGLAGSDDLQIKVSDDGAAWTVAATIDAATGHVGINQSVPTTPLHVGGAARVGSYLVAGVPSALSCGAGSIIHVSNETGGATLAFSDGTNWRRVQDRAVIS